MHTNSARKPYSRKGFQICIQCIQRIPTPPVFRFSLLLGREYMNTVNTRRPRPVHGDLTSVATGIGTIRARRIRPRICIQRPS